MKNEMKKLLELEKMVSAIAEANRPTYSVQAHFEGNKLLYIYDKDSERKQFESLKDLKQYHKFVKNGFVIVVIIFHTREQVELYNEWKAAGLIN